MPETPSDAPRSGRPGMPNLSLVREFGDRSTLWLLEDPEIVRGLLQILEGDLAQRLDFTRAVRENRSFIPADLQKEESDLIFRMPFLGEQQALGQEVWVYVLLEHQSQHDPTMGLRIYSYMDDLWDLQRRQWQDAGLPAEQRRLRPIVPVVLYTGEAAWSTPIGLESLMSVPAALERFVPRWETLLLNLHRTPPETLTRFATAVGWALRGLQAEKAPRDEMARVLNAAMDGLEGLPEDQAGQWLRVAWYLALLVLHRREEEELIELLRDRAQQSKFREREEIVTMGLTLVQAAEARGEARGREEGLTLVQAAEARGEARGREEGLTLVQAAEARGEARGREEGLTLVQAAEARGEARGREEGLTLVQAAEARGREEGLRTALETVLTARFGTLPSEVRAAIIAANAETLEAWLQQASTVARLEEVGISPQG